jgi:hypothetical protein
MKPDGHPGKFDDETASVIWATIDEAKNPFPRQRTPKKERDRAVLDAVRSVLL